MPKNAPLTLDEIDYRLLDELQADVGRSLHALGEQVGLSPSAVQRRIGRYRSSGLLKKQVAVLDPEVVGGVLTLVMVTLERESTEHHAQFRRRVLAAPEVQQCYDLLGEWDYAVLLAIDGLRHWREVVDRLFMNDANIKRFDTFPVSDVVKASLAVRFDS